MNAPIDYYEVLLVHPDAPPEIIRSSYRTLMQSLRNHPDLGGDTDAAALINEAYAVLADPKRRAEYDRRRREPWPGDPKPRLSARPDPVEPSSQDDLGRCLFCGTPHSMSRTLHADDLCTECQSPLFAAERHRLESSGQRMLGRIRRAGTVLCYTRWPQPRAQHAEMRDISLNGMQIAASFSAEPGRIVKLDSEFCRALARVAYCRPAAGRGYLLGVEFVTLVFASARGNFVSARA